MTPTHPVNPAFCWCPLCQAVWRKDPIQLRLLEILEKVERGEIKPLYEEAVERIENEQDEVETPYEEAVKRIVADEKINNNYLCSPLQPATSNWHLGGPPSRREGYFLVNIKDPEDGVFIVVHWDNTEESFYTSEGKYWPPDIMAYRASRWASVF